MLCEATETTDNDSITVSTEAERQKFKMLLVLAAPSTNSAEFCGRFAKASALWFVSLQVSQDC